MWFLLFQRRELQRESYTLTDRDIDTDFFQNHMLRDHFEF